MDGKGAEACSGRGRARRRGYGFIVDVAIMAIEGWDSHCCDWKEEKKEEKARGCVDCSWQRKSQQQKRK